jgi:hypothetical protein
MNAKANKTKDKAPTDIHEFKAHVEEQLNALEEFQEVVELDNWDEAEEILSEMEERFREMRQYMTEQKGEH